MAFTVVFPTNGEALSPEEVANWLTERGEPFDQDTPKTLALRALPVRLVIGENDYIHAHIEVTSGVPLSRMLEMLYALSCLARADVRLLGVGEVSRSQLWLRLADEQDRLRINGAVDRASESGQREELLHQLWPVIAAIREGSDDRWDVRRGRIVELKEVGTEDGIGIDEAAWHIDNPVEGATVGLPVEGTSIHTLAWRWLTDTYPGIAESPRK
jgi:hypothetical protein